MSDKGLPQPPSNSSPPQPAPDSTGTVAQSQPVQLARIAAWQAVVVALITALGGYLVARASTSAQAAPASTVVPEPAVTTVPSLPSGTDAAFELLRDMSIFDLRSWREVPAEAMDSRFSPANYINYLHVKKIRPADTYVAHYGTSGYAVDLRCITHRAKVLRREDTEDEHEKEYAIEVDVSDMPLNTEFLIVIEATYWNGFQGPADEWAATYTDDDIRELGELGLIVLLPESKPFKSYSLWTGPDGGGADKEYIAPHGFYADKNGRFLYWSITTRKPRSHYTLRWTW